MGKIITAWSPVHGQCRTTSTIAAIASLYPRAVITHFQPQLKDGNTTMEVMFGKGEQVMLGTYANTGLNYLSTNFMVHEQSKEDIDMVSVKLTEDLDLIPVSDQTRRDDEKDKNILYILTKLLPKYYQYIFIDLGSERRELARNIQEVADVNLIVYSQNAMLWKKRDDIKNAKYIIADYDYESKMNTSVFFTKTWCKASIVPHCPEYGDAIAEGTAVNFFDKNREILNVRHPNESITNFFKELKNIKTTLRA